MVRMTMTNSKGWYDLALAVSPPTENYLCRGVNIWKSVNGGTSWTINAHWTGDEQAVCAR